MSDSLSRRQENVAATRAELLASAREIFAELGYSAASLDEIAARARLTTGAIYHHFKGKKGLFQAVAEGLEAELLTLAGSVTEPDLWLRLEMGMDVLIRRCAKPDVQRILFVEAPQVIGAEAWREIELRYAFGALKEILSKLRDDGRLRDYPIDLIARMVLSLLREVSVELSGSPNDAHTDKMVGGFIRQMLNGLKVEQVS